MEAQHDAGPDAPDWAAVLALLPQIWPRLATAIPTAARLGAPWQEMSRPFTVTRGAAVVAHAGVLEVPLVLDGREIVAAGVHAVCTAVEARGRGLAREVLEAALAHARAYETIVLHANDPALYRKFGFREIEQVAFTATSTGVRRDAKVTPMRRLSDSDREDVALVHDAFVMRVPVSRVLGVGAAARLFVLDEVLGCGGFARLWYADDLDAVIACDLDDDHVLQIYDIVARELPSIDDIVARVSGRVDAVELLFVPDRIAAPCGASRWTTRPLATPDVLMVQGTFVDAPALVFPPLARC